MNRLQRYAIPLILLLAASSQPARAQSGDRPFEAAVHVAAATSSEFDRRDVGIGGRLTWRPAPLLGADAEVNFYPNDFAGKPAFSRGRVEGLFGVTVGPRLGPVRLFAKLRPGFLTYQAAPAPVVCILIFPPPLSCTLAGGQTLFALDLGGGVELFPSGRTVLRFDAGDRAVRYPGPSFDTSRAVHDDPFFSHDFRVAIGAGLRF